MIGDLIRAYESGRRARHDGQPRRSRRQGMRPAVRTYYDLGWREARLEQLELPLAGRAPRKTLPRNPH